MRSFKKNITVKYNYAVVNLIPSSVECSCCLLSAPGVNIGLV
jgi:hypothetical protein